MTSFHSPDPNLIVSALKFLLETYKLYRSRSGRKTPEKQEEVLEETVAKAEEMSAGGAPAEEVVSEIETKLERDLGPAVKEGIIRRASSILALAQPFEVEAFRYYDNLSEVLKRAQEFCKATNMFRLRGATNSDFAVLQMPKLGLALREVCADYRILTYGLGRGDVLQVRPIGVRTFLSTRVEAIHVALDLELTRAQRTGGTWTDHMKALLFLSGGSEVNKIGFTLNQPVESPYLLDFEVRLTGQQFQQIVSALLDDLNNYANELAEEQREFKERIAPQLAVILGPWIKP